VSSLDDSASILYFSYIYKNPISLMMPVHFICIFLLSESLPSSILGKSSCQFDGGFYDLLISPVGDQSTTHSSLTFEFGI